MFRIFFIKKIQINKIERNLTHLRCQINFDFLMSRLVCNLNEYMYLIKFNSILGNEIR